jgi:hypothetical protein
MYLCAFVAGKQGAKEVIKADFIYRIILCAQFIQSFKSATFRKVVLICFVCLQFFTMKSGCNNVYLHVICNTCKCTCK